MLEMGAGVWEKRGIAGSQGRWGGVQRGKQEGVERSRGWIM